MFKYINIASFKAETYFSHVSPITSAANSMSAQETISYMNSDLTYFKCEKLCSDIQKAIKNIADSSSCIKSILPEAVLNIGTSSAPPNPDRLDFLLPFFEWLKKLITDNNNMRTQCTAEVRNTSSHFSEPFSSFIETLSSISVTHRLSFLGEADGKIRVKTIDRLWGNAGFTAENADFSGDLPSFGTLEWFEAEAHEDIFTFRFLINENFSDAAVDILNDNNYNSIEIVSDKPSFFSSFNNCTGFLSLSGISEEKACCILLSELCSKTDTLGESILTPEEKDILPLARLFHAVNANKPKLRIREANLTEISAVFENRFALDKALKVLENSEFESVKTLAKKMRTAAQNYEPQNTAASIARIKYIFRYFNLYFTQDSCERVELSDCIVNHLKQSQIPSDENNEYIRCFGAAVNAFKKPLEDALFKNGFSGEFPNYEFIEDNIKHALTVSCHLGAYTPKFGDFTYSFSLELICAAFDDTDRKFSAVDFPAPYCQHSKIASEFDGGEIKLVYNLYTGNNNFENVYSAEIEKFVDVAIATFCGKPIPKFYKKEHLKKLHKGSVWSTVLSVLPFIAFAASIFLIIAKLIFTSEFTKVIPLPIFIGSVALCIAIVALIEKIRSKYSIWKK